MGEAAAKQPLVGDEQRVLTEQLARAWTLRTDGSYTRATDVPSGEAVDSQKALLAYYTAAERT